MNAFYIQAILTASLGGVLFGYDLGVISGALPLLSAFFQLTSSQEEWVVALLYFGGGAGAASGGFLCDRFGRKFSIMITDVMFGLGAFLLYSAEDVESVMFGRFVVGWAVAVSGIADVAYLHEISSVWEEEEGAGESGRVREEGDRAVQDDLTSSNDEGRNEHENGTGGRGSVVSVNEACISLGFLLAYGVAYGLADGSQNIDNDANGQASDAWRLMFGFGGCLAALQFLGMWCMPESPVWLHGKGRIQAAIRAQNRIRGIRHHGMSGDPTTVTSSEQMPQSENVGIEMNDSASSSAPPSPLSERSVASFSMEEPTRIPIRNSRLSNCLVYASIKIRSLPSQIKVKCQRLAKETLAPYKNQCAIAFFLASSQQFCGHPNILNFSAEIFSILSPSDQTENVGNELNNENDSIDDYSAELTVGIGILKFLMTCIVILFVEKGGRRLWLLSGMSCILISLTFLMIAFVGRDDEGIGHIKDDGQQQSSSSIKNGLGIAGIYGVAIGYAASYGPLTWLITSEIFPSSIRGRALGFSTIVTYLAAGLVSRTFLSLQEEIGLASCFALYWTATLVSIVFVWLGVPDTGGEKTPEEIGREIDDMWLWGGRRQHRRCSSFSLWKSKCGKRSADSTSWKSVGNYGTNEYERSTSSEHSFNCDSTGLGSTTIASSDASHPGLTPRRTTSNASNDAREII
mmetsp:Transcript_37183/g.78455  ORF Transcript_37183/g.78455 Transcript_37183/m.78455 type:complete len:688 (-) Transcript_37183:2687-4750(-)